VEREPPGYENTDLFAPALLLPFPRTGPIAAIAALNPTHWIKMNIRKSVLIACTVLSIAPFVATGDGGELDLPGNELSIKEAESLCDVIAVSKVVKLGDGSTRMPGYSVYHDANFEIKKVLKGQAKGNVTLAVYVRYDVHRPKEMADYIIFVYTRSDDSRAVGKMLLANEKNEKEISAAVAAVK